MAGIGLALRGAGKVLSKFAKKKAKQNTRKPSKLEEAMKARKKKKARKENLKLGALGAALTGTTGAYIGSQYLDNLKKYPETGKNLKKKNK